VQIEEGEEDDVYDNKDHDEDDDEDEEEEEEEGIDEHCSDNDIQTSRRYKRKRAKVRISNNKRKKRTRNLMDEGIQESDVSKASDDDEENLEVYGT